MFDSKFITPEEQAYYSRLFRYPWLSNIGQVFAQGEEELFDLLCQLRSKPGHLSFSLTSGARLRFVTVEKKWTDGGLRVLLSDGSIGGSQPLGFPCAHVLDEESVWGRNLSEEEWLPPSYLRRYRPLSERGRLYLPIEQCALPANEKTQTTLKISAADALWREQRSKS